MNYITQIQGFWRAHEEHSFNTTEIALYFHLLRICNTCHWKNPFQRSNIKIEADLSISFNTLKNARNKLQQCDLIVFKTKNGSANVMYTLSKFDKVNHEVGSEVCNEVYNEVLPGKYKLNKTKPITPLSPLQGGGCVMMDEKFFDFQKWININAPRVAQMKEPFTQEQHTNILEKYKKNDVLAILQEMHNYKKLLSANISAYLTATAWLNRRTITNGKTQKATYIHD